MTNTELFCKLEGGKTVLGFQLEETRFVKELSCTMWTLSHPYSGARVVYFDSGDEERCFSLSFPAFPEDDTGVFHIIEHCLVEGSQKYPVPDWSTIGPCSSFFSAFTSMDNTMYPVSSCIEKSFQDLVRIYTDSVFSPAFLNSQIPFMQEGWHYEYDEESDTLRCSGIVHSEVKASHDLLYYLITLARYQAAFPDSPYSRNIGGAPENVPELTYVDFLKTYHHFFQPENCLGCVWGNACVYDVLETLAPYFEASPATGSKPVLDVRPAVWNGEPLRLEYPVLQKCEKQDVLGYNWVFGPARLGIVQAHVVTRLAERFLSDRLIQKELCGQVSFSCENEPIYPMLTLLLQGAEEKNLDAARAEIFTGLKELLETGVTQDELEAALTSTEFDLREGPGQVPQGIQTALEVTSAFVHDMPLSMALLYEDALASVREGGWPMLTEFMKRVLLENDRHTEFILTASATLAQRRHDAEQLRLRAARCRLSEERLEEVVENARRLAEHYDKPIDPEVIAALPKTQIGDLPTKVPGKELVVRQTEQGQVLHMESFDGVVRMTLYFPVERFDEEFLNHLGVLGLLFGKVGAAGRTPSETAARIGIYTSGVSAGPTWYAPQGGDILFMEVSFATLADRFDEAQKLLMDLLQNSDYSNLSVVRTVLMRYVNSCAGAIPKPEERVTAYFSHGGAAAQCYGGCGLQRFVQDVLSDFDDRSLSLLKGVSTVARTIFDLSRAAVGIACGSDQWIAVKEQLLFQSTLELGARCTTPLLPSRELFRATGNLQYTAQGAHLTERTGALIALCEAGDRPLRQQIRDIGGAYTVRMKLSPENDFIMLAGRDPNLRSTLETFSHICEHIDKMDDTALSAAVISASANFNSFGKASIGGFSHRKEFEKAAREYWNGLNGQVRQRLWDELLAVTPQQIREAARLLRPATEGKLFCSWASEKKIDEDNDLFDVYKTS